MEEYQLCKIFLDVYSSISKFNSKKSVKIYIEDFDKLENVLTNYIVSIMGISVANNYEEHYREIRKYFENAVLNYQRAEETSLIDFVLTYGENFYRNIDKHEYSSLFFSAIQNIISRDPNGMVISNLGKSYILERLPRKDEDAIPSIYIEDIERFERVLEEFVLATRMSDTFFNSFFEDMEEREAIRYLLEWVIKNATIADLRDVTLYFQKYKCFITDKTLNFIKKPLKVGKLFGDDLYFMRKRANVNYETPFYLAFMLNGEIDKIELPNVRLGIEDIGGEKVAHIIATQTTQSPIDINRDRAINDLIKKLLPKSKNFREFNPSHLVSLVLTFGLLNGLGIKRIVIADYLPLRYQRLVLEERKSDEELYDYQYRLTNKFINNYFRLLEYADGITINDYPNVGSDFMITLEDEITFENEFLNRLYLTAYRVADTYCKEDNEKKLI